LMQAGQTAYYSQRKFASINNDVEILRPLIDQAIQRATTRAQLLQKIPAETNKGHENDTSASAGGPTHQNFQRSSHGWRESLR